MKIFRIKEDVGVFQTASTIEDVGAGWVDHADWFDCRPVAKEWTVPKLHVFNPFKRKGDFLAVTPGALVFREKVMDVMADIMEAAGEVLPATVDGEPVYFLNTLSCIAILDSEKSVWEYYPNGKKRRIAKYSFYSYTEESTLFKIPEESCAYVYCYSGVSDTEDEFLGRYKEYKLTGLLFQELWDSANAGGVVEPGPYTAAPLI